MFHWYVCSPECHEDGFSGRFRREGLFGEVAGDQGYPEVTKEIEGQQLPKTHRKATLEETKHVMQAGPLAVINGNIYTLYI